MKKQTYHILLAFMRYINKPENQSGPFGLCHSLGSFLGKNRFSDQSQTLIVMEFMKIFAKIGLSKMYPFNGSSENYYKEADECAIFQNPERLAFISSFLSGEFRHLITQ